MARRSTFTNSARAEGSVLHARTSLILKPQLRSERRNILPEEVPQDYRRVKTIAGRRRGLVRLRSAPGGCYQAD